MSRSHVYYRVQILADANPFTYLMTSEPFYDPRDAVRAARNLSHIADEKMANILDENGRLAVIFAWTGEGDDATPKIQATAVAKADARLLAALVDAEQP